MNPPKNQPDLFPESETLRLEATIDTPTRKALLTFRRAGSGEEVARVTVLQTAELFYGIRWEIAHRGSLSSDRSTADAVSIRAALGRLRKLFPTGEQAVTWRETPDDPGQALPASAGWKWLGSRLYALFKTAPGTPWRVDATLDCVRSALTLQWSRRADAQPQGHVRITLTTRDTLRWQGEIGGVPGEQRTSTRPAEIRAALREWSARWPVAGADCHATWVHRKPGSRKETHRVEPPFFDATEFIAWFEENIAEMAKQLRGLYSPLGRVMREFDAAFQSDLMREESKLLRKEQKRAEAQQQLRERMEQRERERREAAERRAREQRQAPRAEKRTAPRAECAPVPPVAARIDLPAVTFQETALVLTDLRGWLLRERAASWWVSNQSDDLLALPHCRIERLEYQVRTALRVLGPLRGRALLSDEVGLGKTIEAGLVLKELLTRGLARRFLVLTVPSLVDQWEEELADKFGLTTATTNRALARDDPAAFWRENAGIVASLHTLKQAAHLAVARTVPWDVLIVDEAHYLRNRESQAWQAVDALPRQFLLLLTATPVQNSLEELYNLVTLLQPGQLPAPREFRARFIDPQRPRQPREPEELRRLLGQVMIRNTRANAGITLPPRRAETVLFEPDPDERAFWEAWESELRAELARLSPREASLWGRLLLQTAGSSPAAWREALRKFPNQDAAGAWRERAPLEASWRRKCALLPPLMRGEGGAVIFTQFLETQAALASELGGAGFAAFVINGSTPSAARQPIAEEFRRRGGALLLTHSGTEGRNLQFCHRLVNFDLPWNPMEIEQRIGRLHRLGQTQPVRIYNLVQAGTLQEHLLTLLQEKLNLFELVVGETGLILGERFSSEEFAIEVLRRWRESEGRVAESFAGLGEDLAAARAAYGEVQRLDETLFARDYESL